MIPMFSPSESIDKLRYRYLAYFVIRDAIGFYFGIPKFMEGLDVDKIVKSKLDDKIKDKEVTDQQIEKYRRLITKSINARITHLQEDHKFCQEVLFTDNIWLQLLDIDAQFLHTLLTKLTTEAADELAIVPNWTTRDDSLRRPYLNTERDVRNLKF